MGKSQRSVFLQRGKEGPGPGTKNGGKPENKAGFDDEHLNFEK